MRNERMKSMFIKWPGSTFTKFLLERDRKKEQRSSFLKKNFLYFSGKNFLKKNHNFEDQKGTILKLANTGNG